MKTKLLSLLLFFAMTVGYSQVTSVSITGGSVGGWAVDGVPDTHQMTSTDGIHWTLDGLEITATPVGDPGIKFRANNAWTINWGAATFPAGVGVQNGPNIQGVPEIYDVTFNSETGEYLFEGPPIPVVKIVGTAVPAEGITMVTTDAVNYVANNVTLVDGGAQFDVDTFGDAYGGTTFPEGIAQDPEAMIPVVAGVYSSVTYSTADGIYTFTAAPVYPSIALVGSGTQQGWPNDPQTDAHVLTTTDGETYRGTVILSAWDGVENSGTGNIKFRSNNNWTDPSFGGVTFPTGPAAGTNENIVVTVAGTYDVVFTRSTAAYEFKIATFALVGAGAGGWPTGAAGEIDANVMSTTDGGTTYTLASITLVDGPVKFRANNSWDINFGGTEFPSGVAIFNTPDNIPAIAGTYGVTFNRVTGAFSFGPALATASFDSASFKTFPNPTHNNWNFTSAKEAIQTIQIVDVLGKTVLSIAPQTTTAVVDASALNTGVYFARIATATGSKTVKVVKN